MYWIFYSKKRIIYKNDYLFGGTDAAVCCWDGREKAEGAPNNEDATVADDTDAARVCPFAAISWFDCC